MTPGGELTQSRCDNALPDSVSVTRLAKLSAAVVAATCVPEGCNRFKDDRTPEQAGMTLLALPYEPNLAEWLILANRRILADQQAFLERLAPKRSARFDA